MYGNHHATTDAYDITIIPDNTSPSFVVVIDDMGRVIGREVVKPAPVRIHRSEDSDNVAMNLIVSKDWLRNVPMDNPLRIYAAVAKIKSVLVEMGFPEPILRGV